MTSPFAGLEPDEPLDMAARDGAEPTDDAQEPTPDPTGHEPGWWLTVDGQTAREAVLALWKRQDGVAKKRAAKVRRNELTRAGYRGARVVQAQNTDEVSVRVPLSGDLSPRAPNKADQLIRRIAATLTVDPPGPDVAPNSDTDSERDAAELAERILKVEGSPGERDDTGMLRQLIDLGGTYASMFVLAELNPQGDGLMPLEIQAHPLAKTADQALVDPNDPMGGMADPASLTTRYVTIDGRLSASPADAQQVWQPRVTESILHPGQVRLLPSVGVTDLDDATGCLVGQVRPLSAVIAQCYDGQRPAEGVIQQLVDWRPDDLDWKAWVPTALRPVVDQPPPKRKDGTVTDDALVVTLTLYLRSCGEAPHGAVLVVGGIPTDLCHRDMWKATVGEGDTRRVEYLPLPIAQFRWREDTATGDPFGVAGIEDLAPMEEIRSSALKYILDYMHRFGTLQVFLPVGTTVQPGQLAARDGTPIMVTPGEQPFYEPLPPLSPVVKDVYDMMGAAEDTASGLEETAQGAQSSTVNSGVHAQQVIEQALIAICGIQQNANQCICRVWSVRLALMRARYSAPRILRYGGEGGDFQQRAWSGVDLVGAGDMRIARGTNTMMPRSAKASLARDEMALAMQAGDQLSMQRYQRAITGNTSSLLGLQDDMHRNRIDRQIAQWKDAAKQQHEAPPMVEPQIMDVDPMGQPIMAPPPPDPVAEQAASIFAPNPTDEWPMIAPVRALALADAVASKAFLVADPRFQQAIVAELERMRQAAGIQTRAEQMQMQQQQAQQQQTDAMAQQAAKQADKTSDDAAQVAYAEDTGGPAAQRMAQQAAAAQQIPTPGVPGMEPYE